MNNRKCKVKGRLGMVMETYTHTYDVLLFKSKKTINVKKTFVKLEPKPVVFTGQLKLEL